MTIRLFIAALVLLGIQVGARWAKDRGIPGEPAPLEMKAQDLPTTLGDWKGHDIALDADMFKAIGAVTVADRQYRDPRGRTVSLHLAIFAKSEKPQGVPHPPEDCYLRSGWTAGEPKYVSLDQAGATGNVAKFLPVERGGVSAGLMYWYQVEGAAYWNGDRQRSLLLACRGRPVRPPIVKVLLQASATNPGDAEKALASLAQEVYAWTRGFH